MCYRGLGDPQRIILAMFAFGSFMVPMFGDWANVTGQLNIEPDLLMLPSQFKYTIQNNPARHWGMAMFMYVLWFALLFVGTQNMTGAFWAPDEKSAEKHSHGQSDVLGKLEDFLHRFSSPEARVFANAMIAMGDAMVFWHDSSRYSDAGGFITKMMHLKIPAWMNALLTGIGAFTADLLEVDMAANAALQDTHPKIIAKHYIEIFIVGIWFAGVIFKCSTIAFLSAHQKCPTSFAWYHFDNNCYFISDLYTSSLGFEQIPPLLNYTAAQDRCRNDETIRGQLLSVDASSETDRHLSAFLTTKMTNTTTYSVVNTFNSTTTLEFVPSQTGHTLEMVFSDPAISSTEKAYVCVANPAAVMTKGSRNPNGDQSPGTMAFGMTVLCFFTFIMFAFVAAIRHLVNNPDPEALPGRHLDSTKNTVIGHIAMICIMLSFWGMFMGLIYHSHSEFPNMPIVDGYTSSLLFMLNGATDIVIVLQNILVQTEPRYLFKNGRHVKGFLMGDLIRTFSGGTFLKMDEDKVHYFGDGSSTVDKASTHRTVVEDEGDHPSTANTGPHS